MLAVSTLVHCWARRFRGSTFWMFGALYCVFLAEVASTVGLDGRVKAVIGDDDQRTAERLHYVGKQPAENGFHISSGTRACRQLNILV